MRVLSLVIGVAITVGPILTWAQSYPSKPIRILAPETGSGGDILARVLAQGIANNLSQPLIVENRSGALLADLIANATPDGYTVGLGAGVIWLTSLIQKTTYDPVRDFAPVSMLSATPLLMVVHPSVAATSVRELIALARARPGQLNIASGPNGGESHLAGELFKSMAAVNIVRIAYKGSSLGLNALLAGETQLMIVQATSAMPNVKAGRLRGLAVSSLEPSPLAPGLPTLSASGLPGFETIAIFGVLAPARTPVAIIDRLNRDIESFLGRADTREKFSSLGTEVQSSSPAQFGARIKSELAKWGKVLRDAGIHTE
jgi:tripartite-type tricarboxylate transporter receptor subunit TctC